MQEKREKEKGLGISLKKITWPSKPKSSWLDISSEMEQGRSFLHQLAGGEGAGETAVTSTRRVPHAHGVGHASGPGGCW